MRTLFKSHVYFNKFPKFHFSKALNPNSLLFQQKRDLEKIQKQLTRMKTPKNLEKLIIDENSDFEPGISYLGHSDLIIKAVQRKDKGSEPLKEAFLEDGFVQMQMPFDTDVKLRDSYRLLHFDKIRTGKLLEILDYLTAFTAYRYNNILPISKQATMVTASLDGIELFRNVNLNSRLVMNSYITWTGDSSMEVRVDLFNKSPAALQTNGDKEEELDSDEAFLGSATFMYVARDATYKAKKKVATLTLHNMNEGEEKRRALLRQEIGNENKSIRLKKAQLSLFKSPPSQEESATLHEQFVLYRRNKDFFLSQTSKGMDYGCVVLPNKVNMPNLKIIMETRVEKSVLMHSQNTNINGHVFGGYIMREAMELGYVCSYLHSNKENPTVLSIDSVSFHMPVIIGSIAQFIAHVTFVNEELLHVCVEVFNIVDTQAAPVLTTTLNITYRTKNRTPRVFPNTYECGVKYLEAKRILEKLFNIF